MSDPTDAALGAVRYWTVSPESSAEIAKRLTDAGPGARLRVFPHGRQLTFRVIKPDTTSEAAVPDLNESFPCPPWC